MIYSSKKKGAAETRGVDFEIGDTGTSTHFHWRLKKIACRACQLLKALGKGFSVFLGDTGRELYQRF